MYSCMRKITSVCALPSPWIWELIFFFSSVLYITVLLRPPSLYLSHTDTHTYTYTLFLTHTHTYSLSLSLSLIKLIWVQVTAEYTGGHYYPWKTGKLADIEKKLNSLLTDFFQYSSNDRLFWPLYYHFRT